MAFINPPTLAPPVMGLYSQIAIAPVGRLAILSGQVALDEKGDLVGGNDLRAQAGQVFRNIAAALAVLEATPQQMVHINYYVVNHRAEFLGPIFEAAREVFGDNFPKCASTFLGVQSLALPEWLIEIDGTVSLPD